MTFRSALLALALLAGTARAQQPAPASRDASDAAFRSRVTTLIAAASLPGHPPDRQAARDELFRAVKPRLLLVGAAPDRAQAEALTRAIASLPCVAGRPRLVRAVVHGELAYVAFAGERSGGCTYLLRHDGERWLELLPLGWTLNA